MKICDLYAFLEEKIPSSLSCSWDNDGLMCCHDKNAEVRRVLVALDITGKIVEKAIAESYDLIVAHHPLVFSPLRSVTPDDHVAKKLIDLLRAGVSAMSFHTRLDAIAGGVNDVLAAALGLENVEPFGEGGEAIGRIGELPEAMSLDEFAELVKGATDADSILIADAGRPVHRVAILGGSGSSEVDAARRAGADTYLSGELKYNHLTDAPECGINLLAAGHFHTEHPVCRRIKELLLEADATLCVDIAVSNEIRVL